jgi:hypothetical protein
LMLLQWRPLAAVLFSDRPPWHGRSISNGPPLSPLHVLVEGVGPTAQISLVGSNFFSIGSLYIINC